MARVKYFQLYQSLYKVIRDLPPEEFKRALMPLLEYAFDDVEHEKDPDRFFEAIFTQNVVFIEKLIENTENGKKGGAPAGNKNAHGSGAPKGNKNAQGHGRPKKNKQPDKETETDPDTEKEKETETETEKEKEIRHEASASGSLVAAGSEPMDGVEIAADELMRTRGLAT